MNTFPVNGIQYTKEQYVKVCPHRTADIEVAVANNEAVDDPDGMIRRHKARVVESWRKTLAGLFIEKSA